MATATPRVESAPVAAEYAAKDDSRFPTLDAHDLAQIEPLAVCQTVPDGEHVLRFGDADVDLIVIESGSVDILNPVAGNARIVTHGPGGFIGDIDLLTRRPIVFDAVARGETRVLRVPNAKLRYLLNAVPRLSEKLIVAIQARREALAASGFAGVRVIGPSGCGQTNAIREFLHKNFVPFTWIDYECDEGEKAFIDLGVGSAVAHKTLPAVDCGNGHVLGNPSLAELAAQAGVWHGCLDQTVDLAIIGAGPAGIAAAVYAASEGLSTVVLDKLGPGGQAGGSSKIENFIGFPAGLSGTDLATRGVLQMLKFGAMMVAPVDVGLLRPGDPADEGAPHVLPLDCGATIQAHAVFAATGVSWRRLTAKGAARFERAGVYYACTAVEALLYDQDDVAVIGGGNSAGQAVMFLAEQCRDRTVHLLVRRALGQGMSDYLVSRIRGTPNVKVHEGVEVGEVHGTRTPERVDLVASTDNTQPRGSLDVAAIFVFIGAEPRSSWLPADVARDERGYVLTGADVVRAGKWPLKHRDPCPLETSVPRLLAGGDLRSGSTKRVGFAVGDGSLAVTCVHSLRTRRRERAT